MNVALVSNSLLSDDIIISILCNPLILGQYQFHVRRDMLSSINYICKVKSIPSHPTFDSIFKNKLTNTFLAKPRSSRPLSLRMKTYLDLYQNYFENLITLIPCPEPPWSLPKPFII